MDRTTWCAAEAADKLLSAVQSLFPISSESAAPRNRATLRRVTRCVSEMLADAEPCHSTRCQSECLSNNRAQIGDTLRALLVLLEDETEESDAALASLLSDLRDRLVALQGG